jgi:hypothetical protein
VIWPDAAISSPAAMLWQVVIETDAAVRTRVRAPTFRPEHRVLLIPARMR